MKIMQVVGARPNFMKAAPIIFELSNRNEDYVFVHTGQHFDEGMSRVFFRDLGLPEPDIHLGACASSSIKQITDIMLKLERAIKSERPDLVIVVGDVNSTLAAALSSIKLGVPVAHVEAGYRSGDMSMPEEINRIVVDHISQILFTPTEDAADNLVREGIQRKRVFFVGNLMAETLLRFRSVAKKQAILQKLKLSPKAYALATVHRAENVDCAERLDSLMSTLVESPIPVVLPLHPRTSKKLGQETISRYIQAGLRIVEPLGYLDFIKLLDNAKLMLTDSGGIQEEALMLSVPCLTLRYNTERILTVKLGANKLVGTDRKLILESIQDLLSSEESVFKAPLFWDAKVAERILDVIFDNRDLLMVEPQTSIESQAVFYPAT